MNYKKAGAYSVLLLLIVTPLILNAFIVSAQNPPIAKPPAEQVSDWESIIGSNAFANVMLYIFGKPIAYQGIGAISAGILTVAVWLLLFVTFSDIIATFSTFSKWVAWVVGFLIGVIFANLGWAVDLFVYITGIFAFLGGIAVYVGLGIAFATFIVANLGLFYIKRAMMHQAMKKEAVQDEAGASRVSSAINSLATTEKAFRGAGKDKG